MSYKVVYFCNFWFFETRQFPEVVENIASESRIFLIYVLHKMRKKCSVYVTFVHHTLCIAYLSLNIWIIHQLRNNCYNYA
jgi:hypothetical protein